MLLKPMLASKVENFDALKFPMLASQKLDGIRATVQDGLLYSRNLKPIPNVNVQKLFDGLPDGIDGELILGSPTAENCFRMTTSIVMADDKSAEGIRFHVFDFITAYLTGPEKGEFSARDAYLGKLVKKYSNRFPIVKVEQHLISSLSELESLEEEWLALGHEGAMVRSVNGSYKHGRSSEREGILLKVKRFSDSEAKIISAHELQSNQNESYINELGRTARSSAQAGKIGAGVLGKFEVRDIYSGVEFEIGTGLDAVMREELWRDRKNLAGKIIKYKFFSVGVKTKPRFPVFISFRDSRDL